MARLGICLGLGLACSCRQLLLQLLCPLRQLLRSVQLGMRFLRAGRQGRRQLWFTATLNQCTCARRLSHQQSTIKALLYKSFSACPPLQSRLHCCWDRPA